MQKIQKTVSSHHVITLSRATIYIAYARVYVCGYMRMRIRACARTIIYRHASIRIGIMRSISNPCSMNNDRYRGSCRTVNKVSESIVVLIRNNGTKQTQVQCFMLIILFLQSATNRITEKTYSHRFGLINLYCNTNRVLIDCVQRGIKHYSCFF